jgi:hypothetical protein
MLRFRDLLARASIDIIDLPPSVEMNAVLVYHGTFPDGWGCLLINPYHDLSDDSPETVALIAHELAHVLLARFFNHPSNVLNLYDPALRAQYEQCEIEANDLAAHLLVPPAILANFPSAQYPSVESLARALHVPVYVVERALNRPLFDTTEIQGFLESLIGQADFLDQSVSDAA